MDLTKPQPRAPSINPELAGSIARRPRRNRPGATSVASLLAVLLPAVALVLLMAMFDVPKVRATTPVDLRVQVPVTTVPVSGVIQASLVISAGAQAVDGVEAHLDYDPTKLAVVDASGNLTTSVTPVGPLTDVLLNVADNGLGRIDFAAGLLQGALPTGTFTVATFHLKGVGAVNGTQLSFVTTAPRQTDIVAAGSSVRGLLLTDPVTVTTGARLDGAVGLEGRGPAPSSRWVLPLTVSFFPPGGVSSPLLTRTVTTTAAGGFAVLDVPFGTYDVAVRGLNTLSRRRGAVALTQWLVTTSFGDLHVGDANGDELVSIADFSVLRTSFGWLRGVGGFDERADFNGDDYIGILDFSLLRLHFAEAGPLAASSVRPANRAPDVVVRLVPAAAALRAGQPTAIAIEVVAGEQPVDGVEVHLDFDPSVLAVTDRQGNPVMAIDPAARFDVVLQNAVDNARGCLDFAAGKLEGAAPGGTFPLGAFYLTGKRPAAASALTFQTTQPRRTLAASRGAPVLRAAEGASLTVDPAALGPLGFRSQLPIALSGRGASAGGGW